MKKIFVALALLTLLFSGCQNNLTVTPQDVVLYHDKTAQLEVEPSGSCTFESKDTYHATVDENGLITGEKIGSTEVIVTSGSKSVSVPVTVLPLYILYDDMTENIGKTISEIKSIYGTPDDKASSGKTEGYIYKNLTKYAEAALFIFSGDTCISAMVMVPIKYTSQMADYLMERYMTVSVLNDEVTMVNKDMDVIILFGVYNVKYVCATYSSSSLLSSSKSLMVNVPPMESILEKFNFIFDGHGL